MLSGRYTVTVCWRGFKTQTWEGGIRIPYLMQWPGQIKPGQVIDSPVISLDILPTALAAVGANYLPMQNWMGRIYCRW